MRHGSCGGLHSRGSRVVGSPGAQLGRDGRQDPPAGAGRPHPVVHPIQGEPAAAGVGRAGPRGGSTAGRDGLQGGSGLRCCLPGAPLHPSPLPGSPQPRTCADAWPHGHHGLTGLTGPGPLHRRRVGRGGPGAPHLHHGRGRALLGGEGGRRKGGQGGRPRAAGQGPRACWLLPPLMHAPSEQFACMNACSPAGLTRAWGWSCRSCLRRLRSSVQSAKAALAGCDAEREICPAGVCRLHCASVRRPAWHPPAPGSAQRLRRNGVQWLPPSQLPTLPALRRCTCPAGTTPR